jgi:hypothetical protein
MTAEKDEKVLMMSFHYIYRISGRKYLGFRDISGLECYLSKL